MFFFTFFPLISFDQTFLSKRKVWLHIQASEVLETSEAYYPKFGRVLDKSRSPMYTFCRYYEEVIDMETRIKKWGNSFVLRIPKPIAAEVGFDDDSLVKLSLVDGKLVVVPIIEPDLSLEHLLAQVTEDNLHREVDTGPAVGGEVW